MRSHITAHLPEDLAAIYDATIARRGEIARERLGRGVETPELPAVTAEAGGLDDTLRTLRDPESTSWELDWVRNWDAAGRPAPAPAASADAAEIELEAAI